MKGSMTIPEAARRLGVSYHRVYNMVMRGQLKAERVGSGWAVDARSVEERRSARRPR
jgi:excisionase family DNA binding protein